MNFNFLSDLTALSEPSILASAYTLSPDVIQGVAAGQSFKMPHLY